MATLVIGKDLVQCENCKVWYEPKNGHECSGKDNPYRDSNVKSPETFRRIRQQVQEDVEDILARCAKIKSNSYVGDDGELHTKE